MLLQLVAARGDRLAHLSWKTTLQSISIVIQSGVKDSIITGVKTSMLLLLTQLFLHNTVVLSHALHRLY